jgi:hypothetical protein
MLLLNANGLTLWPWSRTMPQSLVSNTGESISFEILQLAGGTKIHRCRAADGRGGSIGEHVKMDEKYFYRRR